MLFAHIALICKPLNLLPSVFILLSLSQGLLGSKRKKQTRKKATGKKGDKRSKRMTRAEDAGEVERVDVSHEASDAEDDAAELFGDPSDSGDAEDDADGSGSDFADVAPDDVGAWRDTVEALRLPRIDHVTGRIYDRESGNEVGRITEWAVDTDQHKVTIYCRRHSHSKLVRFRDAPSTGAILAWLQAGDTCAPGRAGRDEHMALWPAYCG